jgi:molybdopterin-guanine dinucleotide biosynthesis protein A
MGTAKAGLEWHGSTLLRRVTLVVGRAVGGPVAVVRAPGQELPDLDPSVIVLDDPAEGLGPLQGLAVGLRSASEWAETAFVCSTDLPFLHVAFVRAVMARFGNQDSADADGPDVVLPVVHGFQQPMAAGYRTDLYPRVERLVAEGRLRPAFLFDEVRVARIQEADLLADPTLAGGDPGLDSVLNVNAPQDYQDARARPAPDIVVERFGVLASGGERGPRRVRAATLAEAARAVGLALDRHVVAAVNGDQIGRDGHLPLVSGDTVSFISADAGG